MSILLKHIIRNMSENKFRSFAIIFIVALSTLVSVISLSLQDVINDTYEKVYNASVGEANITITSNDYMDLEQINLDGITVEKSVELYDLTGKFYTGNKVIKAVIKGVDINKFEAMDAVSLVNRQDDFTLDSGKCIISVKAAEMYNLSIGDKVQINVDFQDYIFQIAAIGESNRTFYEEKGNIQFLINLEDANTISNTEHFITKVRLKVTAPLPLDKAVNQIKAMNPELTVYEGEEFETLHFQLQSVNSAMLITMCIVILVGGYIISSLVKIIMVDRIPVIGTFRSIGAGKGKVVSILLLEFATYGIIGTMIGIVLGIVGLPLVADLFNQYREYGVKTEVVYQIPYIMTGSLIGLLLPPVMAVTKILNVNSKGLKDIILQIDTEKYLKPMRTSVAMAVCLVLSGVLYFINTSDNFLFGLLSMFFLIVGGALLAQTMLLVASKVLEKFIHTGGSFELGIKSLRNNKFVKNNSSMIVTITLIFLIVITIIDGISNTAQMDLDSYGFDIITIINKEKEVTAEKISEFDGVIGSFDSYEVMAYGNYANGYCRVYGIEDFAHLNEYTQAIQYNGGNLDTKLSSAENGIVIDKYWAKVRNINIGDKIKLYYDDRNTLEAGDFTVVDLWDCSKGTTDRVFVGISLENYKRIFSDVPERVLIKTSIASHIVADEIAQNYIDTDITVTTTEEFLEEQLNTINTILGILVISVVMAGLVIIIGISSNLVVSFIKRKKEYAILYSVCMDLNQMKQMILWETVASYAAISLTTLLLSFPLVKYIPKVTNGIGLIIDFNMNPVFMAAIFVVTFFIVMFTTIGPIKELKKINIVEELKYE